MKVTDGVTLTFGFHPFCALWCAWCRMYKSTRAESTAGQPSRISVSTLAFCTRRWLLLGLNSTVLTRTGVQALHSRQQGLVSMPMLKNHPCSTSSETSSSESGVVEKDSLLVWEGREIMQVFDSVSLMRIFSHASSFLSSRHLDVSTSTI